MRKITASFLVLFLLSGQCIAGVLSGADLKNDLTNGDSYKWNFGVGYIAGVIDTKEEVYFCLPNIKLKEVVSVVVAYINASPERLSKRADGLVVKALSSKWPCAKKQTPQDVKTPPEFIQKSNSPF